MAFHHSDGHQLYQPPRLPASAEIRYFKMQSYKEFSTHSVRPDQKPQKKAQAEKHPSSRLVLSGAPLHTAYLNGFSNSSSVQHLTPAKTAESFNPS